MPSLLDLPEELWEVIYKHAGTSTDKSALRRCCPALYKSQLISRHVTSCRVYEAFPGEAIKKLRAYPRRATLEKLAIIAQDEEAKGERLEGILEVLLVLSSGSSQVRARLHNVTTLTIQGSLPVREYGYEEEDDIRPRGSLIKAECGELLPRLLPRLLTNNAGQQEGCVEFIDCNLCSGDFLSRLACNVELRSLSINNKRTVADDPSKLMSHVCQFEGLRELSVSLSGRDDDYDYDLDNKTLLLADLYELQALQVLSLSNCFCLDVDVLQYLPNLLELRLHCVDFPTNNHGIQLISPSLQTLCIDKLTFAYHTLGNDLPALKQVRFSSFDISSSYTAPVVNENQLRCMCTDLSKLPLQAKEVFTFACGYGQLRKAGHELRRGGQESRKAVHEQLMSILRVILESPLAYVFRNLKVVSLDFDASQLGPGSFRLIYTLFSGAEQISSPALGCTDDEAIAAAIECSTQLRTLRLYDTGDAKVHASIVPALLAALRLGRSFELCLYVGSGVYGGKNQQLDCIVQEWEGLKRHTAGAGSSVHLSIKHGYPGR